MFVLLTVQKKIIIYCIEKPEYKLGTFPHNEK